MKRKVFTGEGDFHFVTFSTHGRRGLLQTVRSKQIVISVLGTLVNRGKVRVSGFVIMPDHVHAILWFDDDADLPKIIQSWKRASAQHLKRFYQENMPSMIDYFWQRRYYDFNIRSDVKLKEKLEYMHNNPVRKGLSDSPENYKWSSAQWYVLKRSVGVRIDSGF